MNRESKILCVCVAVASLAVSVSCVLRGVAGRTGNDGDGVLNVAPSSSPRASDRPRPTIRPLPSNRPSPVPLPTMTPEPLPVRVVVHQDTHSVRIRKVAVEPPYRDWVWIVISDADTHELFYWMVLPRGTRYFVEFTATPIVHENP